MNFSGEEVNMLSTIATLFGIAKDSLKELERKPIKFITCLMMFLSTVLIKPVIYYSTLYERFCRLSFCFFRFYCLY